MPPPKLLVADDSVTIRRVIELTFADEGVEVIAVSDGRQAIERIERERPDVVLADVSMPERTGYEVAWFVKNNPHLAHVPVLLLSGAFEPVDDARAEEAGCRGVLAKPFEPQVVIRRVRDLLGTPAAKTVPALPEVRATPTQERADGTYATHADIESQDAAFDHPWEFPEQGDTESLDEYFERLDSHYGNAHPVLTPSAHPAESTQTHTASVSAVEPPSVPREALAQTQPVALADAFQSMLAAEEGNGEFAAEPIAAFESGAGAAQSAALGGQPASPFDDLVERASRRIIDELSSAETRQLIDAIVRQIAERVFREELERRGDPPHPQI
jgi:CheY-like chemotaxis protein